MSKYSTDKKEMRDHSHTLFKKKRQRRVIFP